MAKEDIGNRKRFNNRLTKSFPGQMGYDVARYLNLKGVSPEALDKMSAEEFNELMKLVVPMIVDKANSVSLANKNTPWEKKWFDAGQSFNSSWPFNWTRKQFLKTLGREKLSDEKLLEASKDLPKGSLSENILKEPHIGTLNEQDFAALRNAGLYDDEISYLADKFRQEYQDKAVKFAEQESAVENKNAKIALLNEFYKSPVAQMLHTAAPEKWAMMREDILNANDRDIEATGNKILDGLKYYGKLQMDGGIRDDIRTATEGAALMLAPELIAGRVPAGAGTIAGGTGASVLAGVADYANDYASEYYKPSLDKSKNVAITAAIVPGMVGGLMVASKTGVEPLVRASRAANKAVRYGSENPIVVEQQKLNTMIDEAAELQKATKEQGNAIRIGSADKLANEIADKINTSPKAIANKQADTWDALRVTEKLRTKAGINELKSYLENPGKEAYIAQADIVKAPLPEKIKSTKPFEELSKRQKQRVVKSEKDLAERRESAIAKKSDAQDWLDAYEITFPEATADITEVPATCLQRKLNKGAVALAKGVRTFGGVYEPMAVSRNAPRAGLLFGEEDGLEISKDKVANNNNWNPQDSVSQIDPLYFEWLKTRR